MDMEPFFKAVEEGDEGEVTRLLDADPGLLEKANSKGNRPLAVAAAWGHLGLVKLLFQRGASADPTGFTGKTALHWAAHNGQEEVVTFLLRPGAHANTRDDVGRTPLMVACGQGYVGVTQVLLQHVGGEALQETDDKGKTALHWATQKGHQETVAFLLRQGAQANRRDFFDRTPLLRGCREGHLGVVRVLLEHVGGHALHETDDTGKTALHWAAIRGNGEIVTLLLRQGAEASSRDALGGTPFRLACREGHLAVVRMLLQLVGTQGLHETDDRGKTALHWASLRGHGEIVAFLVEHGAEINKRDLFHRTPLLYGYREGHLGVVRVLLEHMGGGVLQETDDKGRTALHRAASRGHEAVVTLLLEQGAQANRRDVSSMTPLMWACEKGHLGVFRMLAEHMGEEGLKEKHAHGMTVLHWAVKKGHHRAVKVLLLAGADPTIADNGGRTPRALAEAQVERAECVTAFEWYECEVERRAILQKATCLHKAFTTQQAMPTSQVPTYLAARVAAGHAVPRVMVSLQPVQRTTRSNTRQVASGKRRAADEGGDPVGEEERHAVLKYVVQALNEHLLTELLEGFPL